jgi:N-acetylgalactosamine-6-sulfatase
LLARWPGVIPAGATCHSMAAIIDLMPTFLEAADVPPPDDASVDGVSLLSLWKGQSSPVHDALHWETQSNYGVAQGDWKLVHERWVPRPYLYDLGKDLGEQNDLANQHPEKMAELLKLHEAWRKRFFPVQFPAPERRSKWRFPSE